jgi:hypothetical protein
MVTTAGYWDVFADVAKRPGMAEMCRLSLHGFDPLVLVRTRVLSAAAFPGQQQRQVPVTNQRRVSSAERS